MCVCVHAHAHVVSPHEIHPLSKFHVYDTVLLTIVTLLCIRSLERKLF